MSRDAIAPLCVLGRYAVYDEIGAGGMARVHVGRQLGAVGFARTVAIKRLSRESARDPDFLAMFTDEARLASRVCHPNVVTTLDVVSGDGELFLVMEYVPGESLAELLRSAQQLGERVPAEIVSSIVVGMLYGLHAAHEAVAEDGTRLEIVHRDVSPHNVLVGTDGGARLLDFGIAKAAVQLHTTREGQVRGKLAYMAPEQLRADRVTRLTDIYAVGVVLWELLVGQRLFSANSEGALVWRILEGQVPRAIDAAPGVGPAMSEVARRALERDPSRRFSSALEMALALERAQPPGSPGLVGGWVARIAAEALRARAALVARVERATQALPAPGAAPARATPVVAAAEPQSGPLLPPARGTGTMTAPVRTTPRERPRWLVLAAIGGAVAAAGLGSTWALSSAAKPSSAAAASASAAPGESAAAASASGETAAASVAAAVESAAAAAGSAAAAPVAAEPPHAAAGGDVPLAAPPASAAAAPPVRRPAPVAPSVRGAKSRCDPPFYVDQSGIRRVKRECLR